jgi:heat shock protein HspQ
LRGTSLVYQVDYCGAFQAGKFTVGQVVDYRVDHERLYILHDIDKEYSCQLEGTWAVEGAKTAAPAAAPPAKP